MAQTFGGPMSAHLQALYAPSKQVEADSFKPTGATSSGSERTVSSGGDGPPAPPVLPGVTSGQDQGGNRRSVTVRPLPVPGQSRQPRVPRTPPLATGAPNPPVLPAVQAAPITAAERAAIMVENNSGPAAPGSASILARVPQTNPNMREDILARMEKMPSAAEMSRNVISQFEWSDPAKVAAYNANIDRAPELLGTQHMTVMGSPEWWRERGQTPPEGYYDAPAAAGGGGVTGNNTPKPAAPAAPAAAQATAPSVDSDLAALNAAGRMNAANVGIARPPVVAPPAAPEVAYPQIYSELRAQQQQRQALGQYLQQTFGHGVQIV